MEQNQATVQLTPEQQWVELRQQFADSQESVDDEQAVELLHQWILVHHQEEFAPFLANEPNPEGTKSLREVLKEAIAAEKEGNPVISQRYSLAYTDQLIRRAKDIYSQIPLPSYSADNEVSSRKPSARSNSNGSKSKRSQRPTDSTALHYSSLLPQIKPKGKLYAPLELSATFQLQEQTVEQYEPRSPRLFHRDLQVKGQSGQNLLSNRYLKLAFFKFCKQSYNYRGLFEEFYNNADKMNMNKWMVFCKEFDFSNQFHSKDLIEIYQTATHFGPTMDLQQFLTAVVILQQKYIERFHTGQNFVQDVLKINSQAAFRVKMENLKVSYSGPKRSSFQKALYPQPLRLDEVEREKQFQIKKKKRQMVLIQGMYEEHLKAQVEKRKEQRQQNKLSPRIQKNHSEAKPASRTERYDVDSKLHTRPQILNYSKIFHITKHKTPRQSTTQNNSELQLANTSFTEKRTRPEDKAKRKQPQILAVNKNEVQRNVEEPKTVISAGQPKREWTEQEHVWLTRLRSDSEESDQILKQHMEIEKKIQKSRENLKVKKLMKEMQAQTQRVEAIKNEIAAEDDDELAETQAQFKTQHRHSHHKT